MPKRKLTVEIIGDERSLVKALGRASNAGSSFGRVMTGVAKAGGLAGVAVGGALASQVVVGLKALARMEKISAQTDAALRSTGAAANVTRAHLERMADTLEKTTSVEAETIQEGQNLLLTFTKIRNAVGKGNRIFDRATETIVNMSVALGQDMRSSAIQLGKALNDPIRGITALRRVGVSFTDEQVDQIRALVESGRVMKAQKVILRELAVEFGKSGRALGNTLEGRMRIIGHLVGEVQEAFAKGFLPVIERVAKVLKDRLADPAFVKRIEEMGEAIAGGVLRAAEALGAWFERNWPAIKEAFRVAAGLAENFADVLGKVREALQGVARVTPGGEGTVLGAILGGALLAKLLGVRNSVGALRLALLALTRAPWLIPIALVLMNRDAIDNWVKNKLGRFYGGGRATARTREEFEQLPDWAKRDLERQGKAPPVVQDFRSPDRRAFGGPVRAGMPYLVGERGPEVFWPGMGGAIAPNPGGGVTIQTVVLPGVTNAREFLTELQRIAGQHASQQRGRHGGLTLALS